MFRLSILEILIFWIFHVFASGASILAIQQTFPVRTGRFRIQVGAVTNKTRTYSLFFFLPLPTVPTGIVHGIMSLQTQNSTCPYLDYSIVTSDITTTGYKLIINLAQTYQISYYAMNLNYFTQCAISNQFFTYSTFHSSTPISQTNSSGIFTRKWEWILDPDITLALNYNFNFFMHQITAHFPSRNFSILFQHSYQSANKTISASYSFSSDIVLTKLTPGAIFFNDKLDTLFGVNYQLRALQTFNTPSSSQNLTFDVSNLPFPNSFLGLKSIKCMETGTKISFLHSYNPTISKYDYIQYTLNPRTKLNSKQLASPYMDYGMIFYYFARISCVEEITHPYLDYQAQLCYDICPAKKYANQSNFCIPCTSCKSISSCESCYDNGCSVGSYFDTSKLPYKCSTCPSKMVDCSECASNSSGIFCSKCNVNKDLEVNTLGQSCIPCNSSSYFHSYDRKCYSCSVIDPDCEQCSSETVCNKCSIISQKQLVMDRCVSCNSSSFYYPGNRTCLLCSSVNTNCESCIYNTGVTVNCTSCSVASQTEIKNHECVLCNSTSYYDSLTKICISCSSLIADCEQCFSSNQNSCTKCLVSSQTILQGGTCVSCETQQFFNFTSRSCHACQSNCISCSSSSICLECASIPNIILQNGVCVLCNSDFSLNSTLPICNYSAAPSFLVEDVNCVISTYDNKTKKCVLIYAPQIIMRSFTMIASIPTLNMFARTFVALIGLFDDLSYYNYHGRNYSVSVEMFFEEMNNFTLARFIPLQLYTIYDKLSLTYSEKILKETVTTTPKQFKEIDHTIYFLKTTESIWTLSLPFSLIFFFFFFCIYWSINRFVKNDFLKNYNFFGMIVVDQVGSNIQYFTFRVFSQLSQLAIFGPMYYTNLTISYFILLVVLIYSVASSVVFSKIYSTTSAKYILSDLFGQSWVVWFNVSNIIKMFTGFVHAYFYHYPQVQTILLTLAYTVRTVFFSCTFKHIQSRFQFTFELFSNFLMMTLQFFFCADILLMGKHQFSASREYHHGNIQCLLIIGMTITQIIHIFITTINNAIVLFKKKANAMIDKQAGIDIQVFEILNSQVKDKHSHPSKDVCQAKNTSSKIHKQPDIIDESSRITTYEPSQQTAKLQNQINNTKSNFRNQIGNGKKPRSKFQVSLKQENKLQGSDTRRRSQQKEVEEYCKPYQKWEQFQKAVIVQNFVKEDISEIEQFSFSKYEGDQKEREGVSKSKKERMQQMDRMGFPFCNQWGKSGKQLCVGVQQRGRVKVKRNDPIRYRSEDA